MVLRAGTLALAGTGPRGGNSGFQIRLRALVTRYGEHEAVQSSFRKRALDTVPRVCESTLNSERTRMMRDDDIQHSHRTVLTSLVRSTSKPPPARAAEAFR